MQRRFDTAVSTMQSDAQRAADEFLEKNPR